MQRDIVDPAPFCVGRQGATSPFAFSATNLPSSPPMTIRPPSDAAHKMPLPWTGAGEISPSAPTRKTFSSAPTKAARSPRKCSEVMAAPIVTGRTRSVTDTMEAALSPGSNSLITW